MALEARSPEGMLRLGYGLVPIAAGADKFTNLLVDWDKYLSPLARRLLPMKPRTFMRLIGAVEIGVGLVVLTRFRKLGSYVAAGWLTAIAANLIACGDYFDIAARDVLLAVGALAHARLLAGQDAQLELGERHLHEGEFRGEEPPLVRSPDVEEPALH
jgi:uncharacterized membrane protein YphA (DoxX/SURF4 family)